MVGDYRKTVSCASFHLRHRHGGDAFLAADWSRMNGLFSSRLAKRQACV
jgi:hypothetical protein